jgi:hypothetical protein
MLCADLFQYLNCEVVSLLSNGYWDFSSRVNQLGCEANQKLTSHLHLVPRLRMCEVNASTAPYVCMSWCVMKHKGQLYPLILWTVQCGVFCLSSIYKCCVVFSIVDLNFNSCQSLPYEQTSVCSTILILISLIILQDKKNESPPLNMILRRLNSTPILTNYFTKFHLNVILLSPPWSSKWLIFEEVPNTCNVYLSFKVGDCFTTIQNHSKMTIFILICCVLQSRRNGNSFWTEQ